MERALECLAANLAGLASASTGGMDSGDATCPAAKVAILAERSDCHVFRGLRDGSVHVSGWDASPVSDEHGEAVVATCGRDRVHFLPGRQVATAERLEVLALMTDVAMPDGRPVEEVIDTVHQAGGLPALNWAPGKWLFGRGRIVRGLLARLSPERLLICDTSLRPKGWTEPLPMRAARRKGFAVIAGSDPLPLPGQERFMGTYGFVSDAPFDESAPVSSLRRILTEHGRTVRCTGRRRGLLRTFIDIGRL